MPVVSRTLTEARGKVEQGAGLVTDSRCNHVRMYRLRCTDRITSNVLHPLKTEPGRSRVDASTLRRYLHSLQFLYGSRGHLPVGGTLFAHGCWRIETGEGESVTGGRLSAGSWESTRLGGGDSSPSSIRISICQGSRLTFLICRSSAGDSKLGGLCAESNEVRTGLSAGGSG